jgi:hypothetical protein
VYGFLSGKIEHISCYWNYEQKTEQILEKWEIGSAKIWRAVY